MFFYLQINVLTSMHYSIMCITTAMTLQFVAMQLQLSIHCVWKKVTPRHRTIKMSNLNEST